MSTSFDKTRTLLPCVFVFVFLKWDKHISLGELKWCALHFRRETYWGLQVVPTACIWGHHWLTLTCVSERVERGKLPVQVPLHLPYPSCNLLISHQFGSQVFSPFPRKKKMTSFLEGQIPIFPPQSFNIFPIFFPKSTDSSSGRPCSSPTIHLCLRWHGCCSLCMSASRPTLLIKV